MSSRNVSFNTIVEAAYGLPLDARLELKSLLEHNIADARRDEILDNYKSARHEHKREKLKFSRSVKELKEQL